MIRIAITASAEADLQDLYDYRLQKRGAEGSDGAEALLVEIYDAIASLAEFPLKGPVVNELDAIGITEWRQFLVTPYRIIYTVDAETLLVAVIADGRRDFASLLERRILRTPIG